ncbi:hypothetical protein [Streptomyces resistomycificus]|uniref:hypothetical protein n=1 Tax=Streptomyces resistomycificus TaxID=67356 RepID=UPI0004AB41B6
MSPRRNRPKGAGSSLSLIHISEWNVRHVAGASAQGKAYRCPGCEQLIPDGVPHVVAWPDHAGVDDRRHWHKACWNAKDRRTTRVQRSRNAPRF